MQQPPNVLMLLVMLIWALVDADNTLLDTSFPVELDDWMLPLGLIEKNTVVMSSNGLSAV